MKQFTDLTSLFRMDLQELYDAEKRELKILSLLHQDIASAELWYLLTRYMDVINDNFEALNNIFSLLGTPAGGRKSRVVADLLTEAKSIVYSPDGNELAEAQFIRNIQHITGYKVTLYNTAFIYAMELEYHEIARMLNRASKNEEIFKHELNKIVENMIARSSKAQARHLASPERKGIMEYMAVSLRSLKGPEANLAYKC